VAYLKKHLGIAGDFSAHFDTRTDFFDTVGTTSKFKLYNVPARLQPDLSAQSHIQFICFS